MVCHSCKRLWVELLKDEWQQLHPLLKLHSAGKLHFVSSALSLSLTLYLP